MLSNLALPKQKIPEFSGPQALCFEQIGRSYRREIEARLALLPANQYIPDSMIVRLKAALPSVHAEMEALAKGAEQPFEKILLLNCGELAGRKACSTIVQFSRDGNAVIGHNEDTSIHRPPSEIGTLIRFRFPQHDIVSYVYFGELIGNAFGWNDSGLFLCMNVVDGIAPQFSPEVVPMYALFRVVLESRSLDEAVALYKEHSVATGYSCLMAQGDKIVVVNGVHADVEVKEIHGVPYAITNHFVDSSFSKHGCPESNSLARVESIRHLLAEGAPLEQILTHTDNSPNAIRGQRGIDTLLTLASIIIAPGSQEVIFYRHY